MRIALVTHHDWFFISHRLPIALEALKEGHEVYLLAIDTGRRKEVEKLGIGFIPIPLNPTGKNPLEELRTFAALRNIYRKIQPDVIHHITMKVSLLGCIAAKSLKIKKVVNAISGFGYAFTDGRKGWLQKAIALEMNWAFKSDHFHFILQNPYDLAQLESKQFVPEKNIHLIKGSGVDLQKFAFRKPEQKERLTLLFPARILGDKGIRELIKAMMEVRLRIEKRAKLILAGDCTATNPTAIHENELKNMLVEDYIEWIGFRQDMASIYQESDIVVLPSYREGLPKALIEACATGRPIITTDVPGCRDCVINGYNGLLVKAKDVGSLAEAIVRMVDNEKMRLTFGQHSRELAEKEFGIDGVVKKHLQIYEQLFHDK